MNDLWENWELAFPLTTKTNLEDSLFPWKKFCFPTSFTQWRDQDKDNEPEAFVLCCLHNPGEMDREDFASSFNFSPPLSSVQQKFAPAGYSNTCMLVKERKANCF